MNLNSAFAKAIKFYWKNKDKKLQTDENRKYNKKYFDSLETGLDGPLEEELKKGKGK